jgi:hypothetical protein
VGVRIDLDHAGVVEEIPADDRAGDPVPVVEDDVQLLGALDRRGVVARLGQHVRVREDVAVAGDDEAGSLRGAAVLEGRVDRDDALRPARVDGGRVEAVAEKRRRCLTRRPAADRSGRHDDRSHLPARSDPARGRADQEHGDGAEGGGGE